MQLTPIGTSPAWYNPGEPNSGFLLEADGARVLIDCGSGVVARYLEMFGADAPIDAVVISHVHPDHCFDLVQLKYGISFGPLHRWRPTLWLPPGAAERLGRLVSTWDSDFSFFEETYDVAHYSGDEPFQVGPFACSAMEVPHFIECHALRVQLGDTSLGYTADLGPTDRIGPFMREVDLLLAEAAFREDGDLDGSGRGHITATEAGRMAAAARARSLLLTHVPVELGLEDACEHARSEFDGPVEIAKSGSRYDVARHLAAAAG